MGGQDTAGASAPCNKGACMAAGADAPRQRYQQNEQWIRQAKNSDANKHLIVDSPTHFSNNKNSKKINNEFNSDPGQDENLKVRQGPRGFLKCWHAWENWKAFA